MLVPPFTEVKNFAQAQILIEELALVNQQARVALSFSDRFDDLIERNDLARLPRRRIMVLSEPRGRVTILPQNFGDCSRALGNDAGISIVAGSEFGYNTCSSHVMIATRQERGACGRTQRGRVEAGVAQALRG